MNNTTNPIFRRKVVYWGMLLTLIFSSILIMQDNSYAGQRNRRGNPVVSEKSLKIGKCLRSLEPNNLVFKIKNISESENNGYKSASRGMKLIAVNLEVKNKGEKEAQLTAITMFKLRDEDNRLYTIVLPEGPESINGVISPNCTVSGRLWYEVPQDKKQFELIICSDMRSQFNETLLNNNNVVWNNNEVPVIIAYLDKNVTLDNLSFQFNNLSTQEVIEPQGYANDYKLLHIDVSIKNTGEQEEQITSGMIFSLMDSQGVRYNMAFPQIDCINGILKPQEEITGKVSFLIKQEKKDYKLEIRPWIMKDVKEYINIGSI